jgi:hypothetical protein
MKTVLAGIAALMLLGTAAWAQEPISDTAGAAGETEAAISGEDELVEGKSRFKETWVHPEADFTQYDKLYLWGGVFEFRDVGPAKRSRSRMTMSHEREFGIDEKDREKFKSTVGEAFEEEMGRSKSFQIVDDIAPDTLIIRGAVLDIISNVPPPMTGRSDVYLATVGEATLVIELIDAETGVIQARVSERRKIQPPGGGRIDQFSMPTNSVTVWADVKRWARSSASKLRKELEKAQKGR